MIRTFLFLLMVVATLGAAEPAKLAGKYEGQVDGKTIRIELRDDGSLSLQPNIDEATVVKGTWKSDRNELKLRVSDPDGGEHVVHLRLQGVDLLLLKHVKPGGDEKSFEPPQFKSAKPVGKDMVGVFRGEVEGKKIELELMEEGKCKVSIDDGEKEERRPGSWTIKDAMVSLEIKAKEGAAKIRLHLSDGGLSLMELTMPDGNQKNFQVRFGKQP